MTAAVRPETSTGVNLTDHPVASLFPLMSPPELDALAADISAHGLMEAIWVDGHGAILDGRNRYRACLKAGIKPRTREWTGNDRQAVEFVASMNLHRRHLTAEQRAFIAAEMANMKGGDAAKVLGRSPDGKLKPSSPDGEDGRRAEKPLVSQREAADAMQIPKRSVEKASAVQRHAPELKDRVLSGDMTLSAAESEALSRARRPEAGAEQEKPPRAAGERNEHLFRQKAPESAVQIGRAVDTVETMVEVFGSHDTVRCRAEARRDWAVRLRKCRTDISRFIAKCEEGL